MEHSQQKFGHLIEISNGLHENQKRLYNYRKGDIREPEYSMPKRITEARKKGK